MSPLDPADERNQILQPPPSVKRFLRFFEDVLHHADAPRMALALRRPVTGMRRERMLVAVRPRAAARQATDEDAGALKELFLAYGIDVAETRAFVQWLHRATDSAIPYYFFMRPDCFFRPTPPAALLGEEQAESGADWAVSPVARPTSLLDARSVDVTRLAPRRTAPTAAERPPAASGEPRDAARPAPDGAGEAAPPVPADVSPSRLPAPRRKAPAMVHAQPMPTVEEPPPARVPLIGMPTLRSATFAGRVLRAAAPVGVGVAAIGIALGAGAAMAAAPARGVAAPHYVVPQAFLPPGQAWAASVFSAGPGGSVFGSALLPAGYPPVLPAFGQTVMPVPPGMRTALIPTNAAGFVPGEAGTVPSVPIHPLVMHGRQAIAPASAPMLAPGALRPNRQLGQMTVMAPSLRVASAEAERKGTAVAFDWSELAKGHRPLDAGGLAALSKALPEEARLIYPALPPDRLPAGAVNLRLAQPVVAQLLEQGYGVPPSAGVADAAVVDARTLAGAGAFAQPLAGRIVPTRPPIEPSLSLWPGRDDRLADDLPHMGSGRSTRRTAYDFLGLPISLAPSLARDTGWRETVAAPAPEPVGGGTIRPEVFTPLRQRVFPAFQSVEAEPDRPAWRRAAPSFGLPDDKPASLFSPVARASRGLSAMPHPPASPASPRLPEASPSPVLLPPLLRHLSVGMPSAPSLSAPAAPPPPRITPIGLRPMPSAVLAMPPAPEISAVPMAPAPLGSTMPSWPLGKASFSSPAAMPSVTVTPSSAGPLPVPYPVWRGSPFARATAPAAPFEDAPPMALRLRPLSLMGALPPVVPPEPLSPPVIAWPSIISPSSIGSHRPPTSRRLGPMITISGSVPADTMVTPSPAGPMPVPVPRPMPFPHRQLPGLALTLPPVRPLAPISLPLETPHIPALPVPRVPAWGGGGWPEVGHAFTNIVTRRPEMLFAPPNPPVARTFSSPAGVLQRASVGGAAEPAAAPVGAARAEGEAKGVKDEQKASAMNQLALEVWSMLKQRLSAEADRRGRW